MNPILFLRTYHPSCSYKIRRKTLSLLVCFCIGLLFSAPNTYAGGTPKNKEKNNTYRTYITLENGTIILGVVVGVVLLTKFFSSEPSTHGNIPKKEMPKEVKPMSVEECNQKTTPKLTSAINVYQHSPFFEQLEQAKEVVQERDAYKKIKSFLDQEKTHALFVESPFMFEREIILSLLIGQSSEKMPCLLFNSGLEQEGHMYKWLLSELKKLDIEPERVKAIPFLFIFVWDRFSFEENDIEKSLEEMFKQFPRSKCVSISDQIKNVDIKRIPFERTVFAVAWNLDDRSIFTEDDIEKNDQEESEDESEELFQEEYDFGFLCEQYARVGSTIKEDKQESGLKPLAFGKRHSFSHSRNDSLVNNEEYDQKKDNKACYHLGALIVLKYLFKESEKKGYGWFKKIHEGDIYKAFIGTYVEKMFQESQQDGLNQETTKQKAIKLWIKISEENKNRVIFRDDSLKKEDKALLRYLPVYFIGQIGRKSEEHIKCYKIQLPFEYEKIDQEESHPVHVSQANGLSLHQRYSSLLAENYVTQKENRPTLSPTDLQYNQQNNFVFPLWKNKTNTSSNPRLNQFMSNEKSVSGGKAPRISMYVHSDPIEQGAV